LETALGGVFGGSIGAGVGAGAGAIISSISFGIKIPIYGNFERFNENKDRLKQYSYMH
jgi:outer membrane lipoprotein SlyB